MTSLSVLTPFPLHLSIFMWFDKKIKFELKFILGEILYLSLRWFVIICNLTVIKDCCNKERMKGKAQLAEVRKQLDIS